MTGSSKRRGLSDFLGKELKTAPAPPAPAKKATKSQSHRLTESVSPSTESEIEVVVAPSLQAAVAEGAPKSVSLEVPEGPLYMRLTRKEVRFRDDQLEALDRVARRLARARRGTGGERITENTLVRVAVDLLLERAEAITGGTEAEILRALRRK